MSLGYGLKRRHDSLLVEQRAVSWRRPRQSLNLMPSLSNLVLATTFMRRSRWKALLLPRRPRGNLGIWVSFWLLAYIWFNWV